MKFLLALAFSVALALATSPLLFTDESSEKAAQKLAAEARKAFQTEPFVLEATEEDSFEEAKFKAALRLLNAYTISINQLRGCATASKDPVITKALTNFHSRNGMTMSHVMLLIKQHGGLTKEIRALLDERAAELIAADPRRGNCPALLKHIADGGEDLYKAPQHRDDYKMLRARADN